MNSSLEAVIKSRREDALLRRDTLSLIFPVDAMFNDQVLLLIGEYHKTLSIQFACCPINRPVATLILRNSNFIVAGIS